MFLKGVWVVQVHTFLKDGLKDILLEQSAHMLLNTNLSCVMGINGLLIGLSVCIHRGHTLEARACLKLTLTPGGRVEANGRLVAWGVKMCIWVSFFSVSYSSHLLLITCIILHLCVCVCVYFFFHQDHIFWFWGAQGVLCKC